ncbi:MAG TPA: hypothetical protein VLG11_04080 [Candidatus Saccharimonadales bacterium]|nr:hypothetical protein [Candidatus Saccharimonadales bacterium]
MSENLEAVNLADLGKYDLRDIAEHLTSAVRATKTSELLHQRHLPGVILRHQNDSDSLRAVFRAKANAKNGNLTTAIFDKERARWAGLGSVMHGLPLREPKNSLFGLLPAKLTRRSSWLAEQQFMDGPNVTAWLDARYEDPADLGAMYAMLAKEGGEGSWTIEPVRSGITIAEAITLGGLQQAAVAPMRYDDNESGLTPPLSNLYLYQPAASSGTEF